MIEYEILEKISEAIILLDPDWNLVFMTSEAERISRVKASDGVGKQFFDVFPDIRNSIFDECYRRVMATRQAETLEAYYEPHDVWIVVTAFPTEDGGIGLALRENTLRKRMEVIASSQSQALDKALTGAPLEEILDILVLAVEDQAGHKAAASILLVSDDGKHLLHGAAPNLPEAYCKAVDGLEIGEGIGSCGTSAYRGTFVIAEDIASDPKWTDFRELAQQSGLRSCWSMPILSSMHKQVLGTFAVYYPQVRKPVEADKHIVEVLSRTAAIVLERDRENRARKRAEEAVTLGVEQLNKQRRLYETALSNTPDLVYIFDLQGRFTYANKALLEMWGKSWEESEGKTCLELGYEPWHAEMHMKEIEQVVATKEPIRGDVPFTGTHGRRMYDYIFVPVIGEDGTVEAVAGTTRDVTERQEAEENARKAEERQRLALQASHSFGIWDWDVKNDVFTADERIGALFNLSPEQARQGVRLGDVTPAIHEDDIGRIKASIEETLQKGGHYKEEYRVRQSDGTIRWVSVRGSVQLDENGEAARFPGVGIDITLERKAIEALREADRKKDEFLATLAHELRNPLAPIRNALHVLKAPRVGKDAEKTAQDVIERQVNQMVRLVDDLMDVSRITRGKIALSTKTLAVQQVIEDAVETVQPLIQEKGHKLAIDFPPEPIYINGDLVRLSQVFSNLINNAAKYTEANGAIEVRVRPSEEQVEIQIRDNGLGIPAEKLPCIFDMFSQVDGSLERSRGGLGIGLTLVKRLVALHGGDVTAESEGLNKGSVFTVCLPSEVTCLEAESNAGSPVSSPQTDHKAKVMIVDDNLDSGQTMGWLMESLGCEVRVLSSGPAAIEAAPSFVPELVLLDIGMPEMNGYDVCQALQKMPELEGAVFIALTGWGQPEHRKRSKESGFHHHLVKPLDMELFKPILADLKKTTKVLPG